MGLISLGRGPIGLGQWWQVRSVGQIRHAKLIKIEIFFNSIYQCTYI